MKTADDLHINHWEHLFDSSMYRDLYPTWWDDRTANHWRHRRFMEPILDILQTPLDSWLTVGDGSGHDSWIMLNAGYKDVLTTDIGDGTLKRSLDEGYIQKCARANAESLQFDDEQFDFVLCKEAFHHMRRPYVGLYEMLRVAKRAVVLIEPQDQYVDFPTRAGAASPTYESVGNYVHPLLPGDSKICLGMNLPGYASKNMMDVYIQGCEFAKAEPSDPLFHQMTATVAAMEARCNGQLDKWNYVMTILFKDEALFKDPALVDRMTSYKWTFESTNTNPHLNDMTQDS